MERLNKFLDETSLWLIFPIFWVLTGFFAWITFFTLEYLILDSYHLKGVHVMFSLLIGLVFGLFFTIGLFAMRTSKKFWDYAKEVEKLIYEKNTLDELNLIYENEWEKLRKMYIGGYIGGANSPQRHELIRLRAMIEIKYEMLNKFTHEQKI